MCGIIGYTGGSQVLPKLFCGLESLEYRGYDSAGIAFYDTKAGMLCLKEKGRVSEIRTLAAGYERDMGRKIDAHCGIGHTRWATHGKPSDLNSHPHCTSDVSLVHNGIIENYAALREELSRRGYRFLSETDTEAAANLIDYYYKQTEDPISAIRAAIREIRGSYAFGILFHDRPSMIYAVRKDSPLILASGEDGNYIASDIPAILKYTDQYYRLEEGEIATVSPALITVYRDGGASFTPEYEKITWSVDAAEKEGFPHFMLKEIHEEPRAVRDTLSSVLSSDIEAFFAENEFDTINIVACGTAMHAGLIGKFMTEKLARIPVNVYIASEFRYQDPILGSRDLVILISQSGETADTIAALRLAKERGAHTLAVVNVIGSTVAREADRMILTLAGPEISVASTKAYSSQITVMYVISIKLAELRGRLSPGEANALLEELGSKVPAAIEEVIGQKEKIRLLAGEFLQCPSVFFIGRGLDCLLASEGSLKLKEITYIHSEAYAAGEMKHGTISLITDGTALDPDYVPDALDAVSADAAACGMIYSFYGRLSVGTTDVELLRSGNLPPTFYCYGTRDPFYDQFLANADAAERAGVSVERLQLDEMPHGFGARGGWITSYDAWLTEIFANQ